MEPRGALPRRRSGASAALMGSEPSGNAGAEGLSENWKSALCVTSLYDSYVAVQHENETLREQVAQLQRENELLRVEARQHKAERPETDDDDGPHDQLVKEIRLLRAEKSQQEKLFDKQRAALEAQLREYKALYEEQMERYQQKFELDPNEPRRVALSTQTLQNTLEQVVQEKEELTMQLGRLKQMYQTLESNHRQIAAELRARVEEMQGVSAAHATQRLRAVLDRWVLARVAHSWRQWRLVVLRERLEATHREDERRKEACCEEKRSVVAQQRVAKLVMKMIHSTSRRYFGEWKTVLQERKRVRALLCEYQTKRKLRLQRHVFSAWRSESRVSGFKEEGARQLLKLVRRHHTHKAWRKWVTILVREKLLQAHREIDVLTDELKQLNRSVHNMQEAFTALQVEHTELRKQYQSRENLYSSQFNGLERCQRAAQDRVGEVFARRSARLYVRSAFKRMQCWFIQRRIRKRKILQLQSERQKMAVRRAVHWLRVSAEEQRRYKHVAGRCIQRMRLLSVHKCFGAWRELTVVRKERVAAFQRVIHHMKHRHLIKSFKAWDEFRHRQQHQRVRLRALCAICTKVQVWDCFENWKQAAIVLSTEAQQVRRTSVENEWKQRLEQSKNELKQLRYCFLVWQTTSINSKKFRHLASKCALKWKNGTLGKCFDEWKGRVHRRRFVKMVMSKYLMRRICMGMRDGLVRWHTQSLLASKENALLAAKHERNVHVDELEAEMERLRISESATMAICAEREEQLKHCLETMQLRLNCVQEAKLTYKIALKAICLDTKLRKTVAKTFRAWRTLVKVKRVHRNVIAEAEENRQTSLVRSTFNRWNAQRLNRLKIEKTMQFLERCIRIQLRKRIFLLWCEYASQSRRWRLLSVRCTKNRESKLCRDVIATWRTETWTNNLLRRTLERIWLTSIHAHMLRCFTTWSEQTRELRIRDEVVHRQKTLASIQARICSRWVNRSLKAVLQAWKEGVDGQKRLRLRLENLKKLLRLQQLEVTFREWKKFHSIRQSQKAWLVTWQSRQEFTALIARWSMWKLETIASKRREIEDLRNREQVSLTALTTAQAEVTELRIKRDQLTLQMEKLQHERDFALSGSEKLLHRSILLRAFHALRTAAIDARRTLRNVSKLQDQRMRRILRNAFTQWRLECTQSLKRASAAKQMLLLRHERYLCAILRSWHCHIEKLHHQKRLLRVFNRRHRSLMFRSVFDAWVAFRMHTRRIGRLVQTIEVTMPRCQIASLFARWKQTTERIKSTCHQQREKQRRIVAYLLGRDEALLSMFFQKWQHEGLLRHERLVKVERLVKASRQQRMMIVLRAWTAAVSRNRQVVAVVQRLFVIFTRYHLRHGFQRLYRESIKNQLERRAAQLREFEHDCSEKDRELEEKTTSLEIFGTKILVLEESNAKHEDNLRRIIESAKADHYQRKQETDRLKALERIIRARFFIPSDFLQLTHAFYRWKTRSTLLSGQLSALSRWFRHAKMRNQMRFFLYWRRRTQSLNKFHLIVQQRNTLIYRAVWNDWIRYIRERALRRRRFLILWIAATHTVKSQQSFDDKVGLSFRIWKLQASFAIITDNCRTLITEKDSLTALLTEEHRRRLFTKWIWRAYSARNDQLRWFIHRWHIEIQRSGRSEHQERTQQLEMKVKAQPIPGNHPHVDPDTMAKIAQGLQLLFRRLAGASIAADLFNTVALTFSQIFNGYASAVLFLLDPPANELWTTQRDSQHITQIPAGLGIAGFVLSRPGTLLVDDAQADSRFHPLVDQIAVSGVSCFNTEGNTAMFTSPIIAVDGVVYGVIQVAFQPTSGSDRHTLVELLGRACCYFVEQILYDMVRNCRDKLRARSPGSFTKLFKQNKNWRKYFVLVEKEAKKTQQQLKQILEEQEFLLEEKNRLQHAMLRLEQERAALEQQRKTSMQRHLDYEDVVKSLISYKRKTTKLKDAVQMKVQELQRKERELEQIVHEYTQYKEEVQTRDWQAMLTTVMSPTKGRKRHEVVHEEGLGGSSSVKDHLLLDAEVAALKNELVRVESDRFLLVKAVDIATRHHGELPGALKAEVNRIALRLKKPRA